MNTTAQTFTREDAEAELAQRGYTFNASTAEFIKGETRGRLCSQPDGSQWFLRLPRLEGFLGLLGGNPFGEACYDKQA